MLPTQLRYPLDRIDENSDYLSVTVVNYQPPGLGESTDGRLFTTNRGVDVNAVGALKQAVRGNILLPIPDALQDSNAVSWTEDSLNPLAAAGLKTIDEFVNALSIQNISDGTAGEKAGASLRGTLQKLRGAVNDDTMKALETALSSSAVNLFGANVDPARLITRATGLAINPNLELLFKGPKLRNFTFPFTLTARSQKEGLEIKKIVNTFKRRMAANDSVGQGTGSEGIFIGSPDVFQLEFKRGNKPHPFLFKLKTCALNSITMNYADGTPFISYYDGTPVKMSMTLTFTELSPIYSSDYDETDEGVGF